jgi:4-hydroxy-tetrahydrodipicolinate synthase
MKVGGIWSAVLTPVDESLSPDAPRAIPYYRSLLERGCDGINLLGTTGEAMSWTVDQRLTFMERIASSGLPMDRAMVGTGAASLEDAVHLTHGALECRFAAALVMPPFFFRDAADEGIVAFFHRLFARTNPPKNSVLLYNFPRMSGITFHPDLVDRLLEEFPGIVAGVKDSSNDAALQVEILARHPSLAVLPGSESELLQAKRRGAMGCISGSVALWPELARATFDSGSPVQGQILMRARATLDGLPFIPAVRCLTASAQDDPSWERCMPPLMALTKTQRQQLDRAIRPFGDYLR